MVVYFSDEQKRKALSKATLAKKKPRQAKPVKTTKNGHVIELASAAKKKQNNVSPAPKKQQQAKQVKKPQVIVSKAQQGKSTPAARLATALRTAEVISQDTRHPQHTTVSQLLDTYRKGWVDGNKFVTLLKSMVV